MSQWTQGAIKSFPCSIALGVHLRVKLSAGLLVLAGANDVELGIAQQNNFSPQTYGLAPNNIPVLLRTAQGTAKMIATGAISQGANVYAAASGQVAGSGSILIGVALEAAVNAGDVIEVLRASALVNPVGSPVAGAATTITGA